MVRVVVGVRFIDSRPTDYDYGYIMVTFAIRVRVNVSVMINTTQNCNPNHLL